MTQEADARPSDSVSSAGPRTTRGEDVPRDERAARTRLLILEAAIAELVEDGYASASTFSIQKRTGFSRGRVLHHFPSTEGLLAAAGEFLAKRRVHATVERSVLSIDEATSGSARLNRVIEFMWATFHEPHFWAATELWIAARTNESLAKELLPAEKHLGAVIRNSVDLFFGRNFVAHPNYVPVRETLLSSMRGAALTYTFDRRDFRNDPHIEQWQTMAALMLLDDE